MMESALNKLFNNYHYFKQSNNTYYKIGRELEYYSYDSNSCIAKVPIINQNTTYKVKISHNNVIHFFTTHLENNKKYLDII
jgi:hypothetical protein